jgi:hypothetical protein
MHMLEYTKERDEDRTEKKGEMRVESSERKIE